MSLHFTIFEEFLVTDIAFMVFQYFMNPRDVLFQQGICVASFLTDITLETFVIFVSCFNVLSQRFRIVEIFDAKFAFVIFYFFMNSFGMFFLSWDISLCVLTLPSVMKNLSHLSHGKGFSFS